MSRRLNHPGRVIATLVGAVGIILWATETVLVTVTTAIPPFQTVALAFVFAASMSPAVWLVTKTHPLEAFRQPLRVWVITVGSLVGYHSAIYFATQQAPPAAAALLQSTTPLMIVIASALLPGERLRWWHVVGALLGFIGVTLLIETGGADDHSSSFFYLGLIGVAAALWGLYSVVARLLPDVPSSTLGMFYAGSAIVAFVPHLAFEAWVEPQPNEWLAIAALGFFPMGLAIYFWDYGLKRGDIQALGAFSYVEPFIGAVIVAGFTGAALNFSLVWSGLLVVSGAITASASLWKRSEISLSTGKDVVLESKDWLLAVAEIRSEANLRELTDLLIKSVNDIRNHNRQNLPRDSQLEELRNALNYVIEIWNGLDTPITKQKASVAKAQKSSPSGASVVAA